MFDNFIQKIQQNNWQVYGVEVFQNGQVTDHHDFVPTARHPIYSATKTILSTAVGFAVTEGKFSPERKLSDYLTDELTRYCPDRITETLPAELPSAPSKHSSEHPSECSPIHFTALPVERFLTMSVDGFPFRPESDDWMDFCLNVPIPEPEKPIFAYSNIPAFLVGAALENALGEHLISYLTPRLFEPLGIDTTNLVWKDCPAGHFYGASGMELTVHELACLGQLYLQNGVWEGTRLLPEDWMKKATSSHISNREGGYGYFIWRYRDGFRISGKWGQTCYISPERGLMVTYMGDLQEHSGEVRKAMEEEIWGV